MYTGVFFVCPELFPLPHYLFWLLWRGFRKLIYNDRWITWTNYPSLWASFTEWSLQCVSFEFWMAPQVKQQISAKASLLFLGLLLTGLLPDLKNKGGNILLGVSKKNFTLEHFIMNHCAATEKKKGACLLPQPGYCPGWVMEWPIYQPSMILVNSPFVMSKSIRRGLQLPWKLMDIKKKFRATDISGLKVCIFQTTRLCFFSHLCIRCILKIMTH